MPPVAITDDQEVTDDPTLTPEPDAVISSPVVSAPEEVDPAESAMIRRFEQDNRRPTAVKDVIDKLEDDRDYVHTEANLPDTPGGVATNYLLRYQWIHQAQIYARDPSVAVRSRKKLGTMVPAIQQLIADFGKTVEYIVQHCANEARLRPTVDGMIQDVDTLGIVFLKVNWIEDLGRDPTGTFRPNDVITDQRKLATMADEFQSGAFTKDDSRYREMTDLAACAQKAMEAEHWRQIAYPTQQPQIGPDGAPMMGDAGLPVLEDIPYPPGQDPRRLRWDGVPTPPQITDLPRYRGFVFDVIDPEDVCWDYTIRRPEMIARGEHFTTRTWMIPSKIRQDYGIKVDEAKDYFPDSGVRDDRSITVDRQRIREDITKDENATERDGALAVWERQCADGYIHTWVQGGRKFLRSVKKDVVTSSRYNVFPLYFNRVTGRVMPVSNVTLGRPLQDEINTVRTHKRQAKRAAYNRYIAEMGLFDEDEQRKLGRCPPEGIVFTKQKIEDIRKGFWQINGQYNESVHNVEEEKQELAQSLGVSTAAAGQTKGAEDSATASAIADKFSGQMADKHRAQLEAFLQEVFTYMAEVLVQALPEDNAKSIAGPGAVWPMIDREALWAHLQVDIEAGSTGKPDAQAKRDGLQQSIGMGTAMGMGADPRQPMWNVPAMLKKAADINDWREDVESLIIMPPVMPMMQDPGMAPDAPTGPDGPPAAAPGPPQQPPHQHGMPVIGHPPAHPPEGHQGPPPSNGPHTLMGPQ